MVVTGTRLVDNKWSVDENGDDLDTVNFESSGVEEGIQGIQGCEISFGGDWNAHQNPFTDPPGLYPRDNLSQTYLYNNVTDASFWRFPYMRVRSARNSTEVRGKVSFESGGKSQGAYTRPAVSV